MARWRTDSRTKLINQLFSEFKVLWPSKFQSRFPGETDLKQSKKSWHRDLPNLSADDIERGIRRCHQDLDWPPQLSEFIRLCRPNFDELGIPVAHAAYVEACTKPSPKDSQTWSHPMVYHTGREVGWQYLHSEKEVYAFPRFKNVYERNVNHLLNGVQVFDAPNARTEKKAAERVLSRDENKQRLSALRQVLNESAA